MNKRKAFIFESKSNKSLFTVIEDLVDSQTGIYAFPNHPIFESFTLSQKKYNLSGLGETVAIVDTGIDSSHPLLKDAVVNEKNFSSESTPEDLNGHGTLVALLIRYVAPKASLLNAKAFDKNGEGDEEAIAKALNWANQAKATVVNMSAGIPEIDPIANLPQIAREKLLSNRFRTNWLVYTLRRHWLNRCQVCEAADGLIDSDISICMAAGNHKHLISCPGRGSKKSILVVGAIEYHLKLMLTGDPDIVNFDSFSFEYRPKPASYSGDWPDIMAPSIEFAEGTSFSTPFVSGTACLIREILRKKDNLPNRIVEIVKNILMETADSMVDFIPQSELAEHLVKEAKNLRD